MRSVAVMFLTRLGGLNALGQSSGSAFRRKWLGAEKGRNPRRGHVKRFGLRNRWRRGWRIDCRYSQG